MNSARDNHSQVPSIEDPKPFYLRANFILGLILILCSIIAYANSFSGVFLFDDIIRIVEEERVHRLWPMGPLLSGERPVADVTLSINYALGGLNPWGYHAVNLFIHILAGLTLFGIVRRTVEIWQQGNEATRQRGGKEDRSAMIEAEQSREAIDNRKSTIDNSGSLIAFAVALIFLVHPLQTQSVTYVIQRGESLMGLFYLLTLYCAVRAMDSPRHWLWCVASVVFCALGMGTKAVMVTAPLMVMIYDWVFLRCEARRVGCAHHRRWPLYAGLCSTWIILWLCGIGPEVLGQSSTTSHVGFSYHGVTPGQYAATQPGVIVKYLQLAFWPAHLCLDYDWPVATQWPQIVLPAITIAVLLSITGWLLWQRHWLGFVGAWFFVILAPTSSIVPIKDLMFEHRMYLPLAAVIAALVVPIGLWFPKQIGNWKLAIGNTIDNRQSSIDNSLSKIFFAIIFLAVSVPLAYATHLRNRDYQSELTMWQDVAANRPSNARAHVGIGNALVARDQLAPALEEARKATEIDPESADAHCATGLILSKLGRTEEAIVSYETAVRIDPGHSRAWYSLGNALERLGQHEEAVRAFQKSTEANPQFADAWCNLGNALAQENRINEAIECFRRTITVDPRHAKGHNNLGDALKKIGNLNEAQQEFQQAIAIQPDYNKARINLALLYKQRGELDAALEQCKIVLQSDPANRGAEELTRSIEAGRGK